MTAAALAFALLAGAAGAAQQRTDLGREGNERVARTFFEYARRNAGGACRPSGGGRRVLITGFGPFLEGEDDEADPVEGPGSGLSAAVLDKLEGRVAPQPSGAAASGGPSSGKPPAGPPPAAAAGPQTESIENLAGTIARSMADERFWPASVPSLAQARPGRGRPTLGRLRSSDRGGRAFSRSLEIEGRRYDACFLILDVTWDLAAAILVHEVSAFKPELVMMLGRGGKAAHVETVAANRASRTAGHAASGDTLGDRNRPESDWILPDYPVDHRLPMRWSATAVAEAMTPHLEGLSAAPAVGSEPGGSYLCNALSFVALHATGNRPTRLAGDHVQLPSPELPSPPAVGFVHVPAFPSPESEVFPAAVFAWSRAVAAGVSAALAGR